MCPRVNNPLYSTERKEISLLVYAILHSNVAELYCWVMLQSSALNTFVSVAPELERRASPMQFPGQLKDNESKAGSCMVM